MDVLTVEGSGEERFYVMALEDVDGSTHYWYKNAYGKLDKPVGIEEDDFGKGEENTIKMIENWNKNGGEGSYGAQDTNDMWGIIQSKVGDISNPTWFVPSYGEWLAFGDYMTTNLGLTTSNYNSEFGLNSSYWSSSQYDTEYANSVVFSLGYMFAGSVDSNDYVRLSATF